MQKCKIIKQIDVLKVKLNQETTGYFEKIGIRLRLRKLKARLNLL